MLAISSAIVIPSRPSRMGVSAASSPPCKGAQPHTVPVSPVCPPMLLCLRRGLRSSSPELVDPDV